jgi:hypothetical protein
MANPDGSLRAARLPYLFRAASNPLERENGIQAGL